MRHPSPGLSRAAARAVRLLELEANATRERALLYATPKHREGLEHAMKLERAALQLRNEVEMNAMVF